MIPPYREEFASTHDPLRRSASKNHDTSFCSNLLLKNTESDPPFSLILSRFPHPAYLYPPSRRWHLTSESFAEGNYVCDQNCPSTVKIPKKFGLDEVTVSRCLSRGGIRRVYRKES